MIVTKIEEYKKDRFKIFIDEEFAFCLYRGELKTYKVILNEALSESDYNTILNELLPKRAKMRAMNLLKAHMYTERDLRNKLKDGLYPQGCINVAIEYVKSYGYVNDYEYARQYIMGRADQKSRIELKNYLLNKGISVDVFELVYEEFLNEVDESDIIKKLLIKKLNGRDANNLDINEKNKLIRYLVRKGFSYSRIVDVFESI